MTEFLGIKEAAEYLNVEYKTIYRLVRAGELPAGKIGGVYRIRKEDIEAYWARQAGTLKPAAVVESCAACGQPIASRDFIGGSCEICGAPICKSCWRLDGKRLCADHADMEIKTAEAEKPARLAMLQCGHCRRIILDATQVAGRCAGPDCNEPLCLTCWAAGERHCRAHTETPAQKLDQARAALQRGEISVLVPRGEAKRREINFINRFDRKILSIQTLRNPLSGAIYRVERWDKYHTSEDEAGRLMELLRVGFLERQISDTMPLNLRSRYRLDDPKAPSDQPKGLLIEARVLSHLESHLRDGFDTQPFDLDELSSILVEAMHQAEEEHVVYILGLASTTGWTAGACRHIAASRRGDSFTHRLLLPCLIDLESHALITNSLDARLEAFAPLFSLKLYEEEVADVMAYVQDAVWSGSLTLSQVVERMGIDEKVVKEAFSRLAASGEYRVDEINGLGRVISRA